ncbi:ferric reductase [Nocardioides immobilis]|uniref:Ferric reductase n=1 Tax=Nocardioides immobilis TaxID=2049295 RepID=A0A417Y4S2_9ACTN|nr:ferric reductase [Nocardioides immobilis]RHW27576.1 ferric reductase [Nocardioides immobilis]
MSTAMLWFLNRGTGMVLLGVLTATVLLGVLAARGRAGSLLPAFVSRSLHRNLSLFGAILLVAHIATAVLDEFVDIRWWHAFVPYGAAYEPWWLAVGTLASDLILAVLVTTAVRGRLGLRCWQRVHQLAYLAWALGLVHGLMIGSDSGETWALISYSAAAGVVAVAVLLRLLSPTAAELEGERV